MEDFHVSINETGRIVIPAPIRKKLNLRKGDDLIVKLSEQNIINIQTPKQYLDKLQNLIKSKDKNLTLSEDLMNMRKEEQL
jgi:AbrB family looped-hinge helix DNA binding protein|tara:strand:+ start:221 stop:463 length:243 start_codon:yes stop_codon:yes gene_type:complete